MNITAVYRLILLVQSSNLCISYINSAPIADRLVNRISTWVAPPGLRQLEPVAVSLGSVGRGENHGQRVLAIYHWDLVTNLPFKLQPQSANIRHLRDREQA